VPLSALVDGELVCAPLLPPQRWQQVRGRRVILQPCGHGGFARVSPLGTPHFVHERDSDCHARESPEHLHLKAVVARAVAAAGWEPWTEAPGDGFVADVLATRRDQKVAFEVQRSRQVLSKYRQRQQTYARSGVRAVWLVHSVPAGHLDGPDLPLFLVTDWLQDPRCVVVGRPTAVADLVAALLEGRCRWQQSVPVHREGVEWLRIVCPLCGSERRVVVQRWLQGRCRCGVPAVVTDPARPWTEQRCCGYWGPGLGVAVHRASRATSGEAVHGHWCLSA
jgi:hypothetical protein